MRVLFRWESKGICAIYVDGDYLILMSDFTHGVKAMTLLRDSLVRLAEGRDGEVIIEGDDGILNGNLI